MLSDRDLARHASAMYGYQDAEPIAWDHYQADSPERPVCWGLKYVGGDTVVALRGSSTLYDWLFNVAAAPVPAGPLGHVHGGFYAGIEASWTAIKPLVKGRLFVAGHSRAGGQAPLLAAVAKRDGVKPTRFVGLGAARAGFAQLEDYLSDVPGRIYRAVAGGFHDPVCDVPFTLHLWPYVHVRQPIDLHVTITEAAVKDMEAFAIHFCPGYVAAL